MSDVVVRPAGRKGLGVFATRPFAGDAVVFPWEQGRLVRRADLPSLSEWEREHLEEVEIDEWRVLPEPRCYLNHACAPNAVSTGGMVRALREIAENEEITIDYRLNAYDDGDVWTMACDCGAEAGTHTVIGDFFSLSAAQQARSLPDAPAFIQRMHRQRHGGS